MSGPDEFAVQPEELQRVLIQLQLLRNADAALHGERPNWLAARRLAIYAKCCQDREPLVQVMNTDPPCVLLGQVIYSEDALIRFVDSDLDRSLWQGAGQARGHEGIVWLSTFERMAERGGKQWLWCRCRRWWIDPADVVSLRGEHTDVLRTDISGRIR
jgi:hypothetical protein